MQIGMIGLGVNGVLEATTVQDKRRPATDYTARVIPHCDSVAVPLEAAEILWQR
jgi:hypothetical protein